MCRGVGEREKREREGEKGEREGEKREREGEKREREGREGGEKGGGEGGERGGKFAFIHAEENFTVFLEYFQPDKRFFFFFFFFVVVVNNYYSLISFIYLFLFILFQKYKWRNYFRKQKIIISHRN